MLIGVDHAVYGLADRQTMSFEFIWNGESVRVIAEAPPHPLIGVEHGRLIRYENDNRMPYGAVGHDIACLLILARNPLRFLVGTEEAHLYQYVEGTSGPHPLTQFDNLSCRQTWHIPWGGPPAVRSLAAAPDGVTVYADIHVGSIMRSSARGVTWAPVTGDFHEDVHQVATCRSAQGRVYTTTAMAVWISNDGGRSWLDRGAGLKHRYRHAIAVHPDKPDCLLASENDGPHSGNDQFSQSNDVGRRWQHVSGGCSETTRGNIDSHQLLFDQTGAGWAAVGHDLYASGDEGKSWTWI